MEEMHLVEDFKEFFQLLNAHGVEYLLIGGYAVVLYGYSGGHIDNLNIWISNKPENIDKVIEVLKEFGFDVPELNREIFLTGKIARLGNPPFRIKIMTKISGVEFDNCYSSAQKTIIDGQKIKIISKEDLIKNKKATNRYKDLDDLENLI